jgi:thioredoxin-related protein/YHS domain-containing protein
VYKRQKNWDAAMRQFKVLLTLLAVVTVNLPISEPAQAAAKSKIKWHTSLRTAGQESIRTGKPVLIQFTATWCTYCHKMLETTFHDPKVVRHVNEFFVPVLLDADDNEKVVEILKVDSFPSTVIVSSKQELLAKFSGFHKTPEFMREVLPFSQQPPTKSKSVAKSTGSSKSDAQVAIKESPPLAFNGLCLVSMLNERKWTAGNDQFTTEIRGMKIQFASAEYKAEFLKTPSKYWPMRDGLCPVASIQKEKLAIGDPTTAAVYRNQLVFFKSVDHRKTFAKDPQGFTPKAIASKNEPRNVLR